MIYEVFASENRRGAKRGEKRREKKGKRVMMNSYGF
jgi:hypothetical protein